jgi:hypothetical protein
VLSRNRDLVALLEVGGHDPPIVVLERAASTIKQLYGGALRAGIGTPFHGLVGFGPRDIGVFDELTASGGEGARDLIPPAMRSVLGDEALRATLEAFVHADQNVGEAASALALHPNSLRYRLQRIADKTGRDPRRLSDLLELIAAARLLHDHNGSSPARSTASLGGLAQQKGDPHAVWAPSVREVAEVVVAREGVEAIRSCDGLSEPWLEERQVVRVAGAAQQDQLGAEGSDSRQRAQMPERFVVGQRAQVGGVKLALQSRARDRVQAGDLAGEDPGEGLNSEQRLG